MYVKLLPFALRRDIQPFMVLGSLVRVRCGSESVPITAVGMNICVTDQEFTTYSSATGSCFAPSVINFSVVLPDSSSNPPRSRDVSCPRLGCPSWSKPRIR